MFKDHDKDFSSKDKDCIVKDKDCILVLKESLRTRTKTNITERYSPPLLWILNTPLDKIICSKCTTDMVLIYATK